MSCHWYEEHLANEKSELWINGRPSPALLAHTRDCDLCAKIADRELELRSALLGLAESSQHLSPSESVKRNLLAELEAHVPVRPRRIFSLRFALAAAAVLCLAIGLLYWRNSHPQTMPGVARQPQVQPQQVAAQSEAATAPKQPQPATVAGAPKKVVRRAATVAQQQVPNNDFYPVIMCDSLTCSGPTVAVRVEIPASPLVNRGGGSSRTVMADLLVGEDGLVRGVRVLQ